MTTRTTTTTTLRRTTSHDMRRNRLYYCTRNVSKWTPAVAATNGLCQTRQHQQQRTVTMSPNSSSSSMFPTWTTTTTRTTKMNKEQADRRRYFSSSFPRQSFSTMSQNHHHRVDAAQEKASSSSSLYSVTVHENGSAVTLRFAQDAPHSNHDDDNVNDEDNALCNLLRMSPISVFHASWLWLNDPSFVHETSGQRTRPSATTFYGHYIQHAEIVMDLPATATSHGTTTATRGVKIPLPPPAKDCLHPIGSVYQTTGSRADEKSEEFTRNSNKTNLLKIVWGHTDERRKDNANDHDDSEPLESFYDLNWLWRCRYDDAALQYRQSQTQVTKQTALRRDSQLVSIDYNLTSLDDDETTTTTRDKALFDILDAIVRDGAVIVNHAPTWQDYTSRDKDERRQQQQEETVGRLGRALAGGSLSHGSLYGDIFHVQSIPDAHNIAYTNHALPPHQDLSYFESKPGLQLLHCLANDKSTIVGGESTMIDALAAATELKRLTPHLYQVLVQTEATFVKQRHNADMVARRPHIVQDASTGSCVVQVSWSPPFEGPACVAPQHMEDYILAHAALTRLLDQSLPRDQFLLSPRLDPALERELMDYAHEYTWTKRLDPGEILIFNNQRMLHGRAAFEYVAPSLCNQDQSGGGGGGRHLIGCYTNLDDTLSQYRMLRRRFGKQSLSSSSSSLSNPSFIRNLGNGFSGGI